MNNEQSLGQSINAHVKLALANQQKVVEDLSKLAQVEEKYGILIKPKFEDDKIIIQGELSDKVPFGEIYIVDFTDFKEFSDE